MRVLIVDDDDAVRPFLDRLLTAKGFNTLSAPSADHADALLLDFPTPPDVAVLDLTLPGRGGVTYGDDLTRRFPQIRLVFITGHQYGDTVEAAAKRGRLVYKPFYPLDLIDAIQDQS